WGGWRRAGRRREVRGGEGLDGALDTRRRERLVPCVEGPLPERGSEGQFGTGAGGERPPGEHDDAVGVGDLLQVPQQGGLEVEAFFGKVLVPGHTDRNEPVLAVVFGWGDHVVASLAPGQRDAIEGGEVELGDATHRPGDVDGRCCHGYSVDRPVGECGSLARTAGEVLTELNQNPVYNRAKRVYVQVRPHKGAD